MARPKAAAVNGDKCRWRAMCHKHAVGRVIVAHSDDDDSPLAIGHYCAEHLAIFAQLHPTASRAQFTVEYDQPG